MSPFEIEVMFWHYYSPEPFPREHASLYQSVVDNYISHGLLKEEHDEKYGGRYKATERGRAWVELICSTPYPQKRTEWYDPRTNESISSM